MKQIAILFLFTIFVLNCGHDLSQYDRFVEPQISEKQPQKMLVYEIMGDPNETAGVAIGALYSAFYKMKKEYQMEMAAPKARWPQPPDTPREEWIGIFGLEIPESLSNLPKEISDKYPQLKIETWEYGLVAEIMHVGSYATEHSTVQKLIDFISESGYQIVGGHEEEYLKGPGMFFKGNPEKYKTIIRFPVREK
ncbi:MAG: GyrI-like domain-containing protein [Candidatus Marinimicrobia bacterium]|nr:GyrI-like domain-containing protein [Candidatus Neomarinimicrobiota bacterium]